jgi:hypothetical protein
MKDLGKINNFLGMEMSRLFAKGPKTVLELTCFSLTATYKMLGN